MGTLTQGPGRKLNIVYENPKVIYITIPKSANTSIKHRLINLYHGKDLKISNVHNNQYGADADQAFVMENRDKYFVFSFVRNPWSRAVSFYKNKIMVRGGGTSRILTRHPCFSVGMPFDKFVRALYESNIDVDFGGAHTDGPELHIRSQSSWLFTKDGELIPSFVGKIESFDEDWKKMCLLAGLEYSPMVQKNQTSSTDEWKLFYKNSPELRQMIGEIYKSDVKNFYS